MAATNAERAAIVNVKPSEAIVLLIQHSIS